MNTATIARRNICPIKVWVTKEEKMTINNNAKLHGLSNSAFLRNLGLNITVNGIVDQQAILEIVKVNADLGRLGGLLKLWLTNNEKLDGYDHDINNLLDDITKTQLILFEKVSKF
ncbi:hypothetical protein J3U08_11155 [Gilliamella sp. B2894]|uniref:plasmid mobilization protein n=1 Tax=Gilliamella sp. B2894 TaxID=2817978 RepID=UPI00226A313A|nr:CopG family transcriptional regulator [Gilliamella sp. B2894]MCX8657348.1 hypothetical protein [Gilliamella sp. B2894]